MGNEDRMTGTTSPDTSALTDVETQERSRASEQDDVAEPDAPTATEENTGMSTVLSTDPILGVQADASEE